MLNQQTTINGYQYTLNYSQYSLQTNKLSPQQLINQFSNLSNFTESYSVSQYQYTSNPYKNDQFFINQQQSYQLYDTQLQNTKDNSMLKDLKSTINHTFTIKSNEIIKLLKCTAKLNEIWSVDVCKTREIENGVQCHCEELSPTTIFEATVDLGNSFANIFTADYYLTNIFTYILLIQTIIYFWFLFFGYKQDQNINQISKIYPEQFQPKQQQIKSYPPPLIRTQTIQNQQNREQLSDASFRSNLYVCRGSPQTRKSKKNLERITSIYSERQIERPLQIIPVNSEFGKETLYKSSIPFSNFKTLQDEVIQHENQTFSPKTIIKTGERSGDTDFINQKIAGSESSVTIPFNKLEITTQKSEGLIQQIQQQKLKQMEGFKLYLKVQIPKQLESSQIAGIYNRYDEKSSRVTRSTMMYISMLGQMAVLTFFGKLINLNTIIALSLLQTLFGVSYKKLLSFAIESNNRLVNHFGFNLAFFGFTLFYLVILSGISKYDSSILSVMWGLAYLSNLFLDLVVYSIIAQALLFYVIVKYQNHKIITKLCQVCISETEKEFFYGKVADNNEIQGNEEEEMKKQNAQ